MYKQVETKDQVVLEGGIKVNPVATLKWGSTGFACQIVNINDAYEVAYENPDGTFSIAPGPVTDDIMAVMTSLPPP